MGVVRRARKALGYGSNLKVLDSVQFAGSTSKTITTYAQDMSEFLKESELTERRTFIDSFVKEIVVMPDNALMRYTVPMPDDSLIPGKNVEDIALSGSVLATVPVGGPTGTVLQTSRWEVAL